jgi:rubrerythrin
MAEPAKGSVPLPDPTVLTTENLRREIDNLTKLIDARLDGMDKAVIIFQDSLTRVPTDTDKQVGHLRELLLSELAKVSQMHEEKFRSIGVQFTERDVRTEQTSRDSKVAVDAALQAAKEAVGEQNKSSALAIAKSEAATTKQIDQLGVLISNTTAGLNDKIEDIKARLTLIEGKDSGGATRSQSTLAMMSIAVAAVAAFISIAAILYSGNKTPDSTLAITHLTDAVTQMQQQLNVHLVPVPTK